MNHVINHVELSMVNHSLMIVLNHMINHEVSEVRVRFWCGCGSRVRVLVRVNILRCGCAGAVFGCGYIFSGNLRTTPTSLTHPYISRDFEYHIYFTHYKV